MAKLSTKINYVEADDFFEKAARTGYLDIEVTCLGRTEVRVELK